MITNKEIQAIKLSPTKKDFYQIWNELLEVAGKISDRWSPESTNESDPGIVLLKVLTAVADKLNYTIDKNILEAFMPSCAQEESMRKLCEMMGYNIKYYQSAETMVKITFNAPEDFEWPSGNVLNFPRWTVFTNTDGTINYVSLEAFSIDKYYGFKEVNVIEGEHVSCETNDDNIITLALIDDNHRYYLPENQIAENGIFVENASGLSSKFIQVSNLNTQPLNTKCFKFGYDSNKRRPYIQFPDDISALIGEGLKIDYIRTSGINGNIARNTLTTLGTTISINKTDGNTEDLDPSGFTITNLNAATNGRNIETIRQAYKNFKRTVGTFDTLVTCRDYMNKIYEAMDSQNIPLVSNIMASDIRDDINKAITICSFNDYGISYVSKALCDNTVTDPEPKINNFDLVLYPFKTVKGYGTKSEYDDSFKFSGENIDLIESAVEENKTLAHNIIYPFEEEIICIKNYLRLKAKITTTHKVNIAEEKLILLAIKTAIYNRFNMRELDFGEEIPYDDILECIEQADVNIKNVSLDEPTLYTSVALRNGSEYIVSNTDLNSSDKRTIAKKQYNNLVLRNVLAGRIPMFDYDESFKPSFTEAALEDSTYDPMYKSEAPTFDATGECTNPDREILTNLSAEFNLPSNSNETEYTLKENEVIKFKAPNLRTTVTYPAYVNYHFKIDRTGEAPKPANFITLKNFIANTDEIDINNVRSNATNDDLFELVTISDETNFNAAKASNVNEFERLYIKGETKYTAQDTYVASTSYYKPVLTESNLREWSDFILSLNITDNIEYSGLYTRRTASLYSESGYLKDNDYRYYKVSSWNSTFNSTELYVQNSNNAVSNNNYNLGADRILAFIPAKSDYQLQTNEYLIVEYTPSSDNNSATPVIKEYKTGDIIRPSFDLSSTSSIIVSGTKSKTKTIKWNNQDCELFSLDPNQQIEIRELAEVKLFSDKEADESKAVYIYCILTDYEKLQNDTNKITFTLSDNEYFFYTDLAQTSLAYYGAGTAVTLPKTIAERLYNSCLNNTITAAKIFDNGISAINWVKVTITSSANIVLQEYRYITLTKGDTIKYNKEGNTTEVISYNDGQTLPVINVENCTWVMETSLDINMSPTKSQILYENDKITIGFAPESNKDNKDIIGTEEGIALKSNYICKSTTGNFNITNLFYDYSTDDYKYDATKNDFALKLFSDSGAVQQIPNDDADTAEPELEDNIELHNYKNKWTIAELTKKLNGNTNKAYQVILNTTIPNTTNSYGLMSIYVIKQKEESENPTISFTAGDVNFFEADILNSNNANVSSLELHKGLNTIKINKSTKLTIAPGTTSADNNTTELSDDIIIFSDFDIVKTTSNNSYGISPLLKYNAIDGEDSSVQLISDIINIIGKDVKFYWNCPIEYNKAIDVNTLLVDTENEDNLSNPRSYYDPNNIVNKFVISEIDSSYLDAGITITKSSKL